MYFPLSVRPIFLGKSRCLKHCLRLFLLRSLFTCFLSSSQLMYVCVFTVLLFTTSLSHRWKRCQSLLWVSERIFSPPSRTWRSCSVHLEVSVVGMNHYRAVNRDLPVETQSQHHDKGPHCVSVCVYDEDRPWLEGSVICVDESGLLLNHCIVWNHKHDKICHFLCVPTIQLIVLNWLSWNFNVPNGFAWR